MIESGEWERHVDAVWNTATSRTEEEVIEAITELVRQRPEGDAAALYEQASAFDYAGREAEAEPLYRQALAAGLDPKRRPRAVIQLASTLRNLNQAEEAVALLQAETADDDLADARSAFLALALMAAGRPEQALARALTALAGHLTDYRRAVLT